MDPRTKNLKGIRPEVQSAVLRTTIGDEERFQNETLRPIIKFQNNLFVEVFKNYINKHKGRFYELSGEERFHYIENSIQRDIKFRNSLKGMVIGQFTCEEYLEYIKNSSALNKRMMNMVIERLKDQVQLLQVEVLAQ
ncbi:glyoxalase [Allomuricauda sp. SCSIO 65647]|uniref:glyoxalase n=1 Tax=Allomuricauda sp. SCSIO 65647 TaxID=2908843 RepID=UPI001F2D9690|nr:glyoxalase [Muricauda sp. SCSIO 65647]UJH67272.1 glyoxalase [Muricauda sp. SCSIO 65647]